MTDLLEEARKALEEWREKHLEEAKKLGAKPYEWVKPQPAK